MTLPAGHGIPVEFPPEEVCDGLTEPAGAEVEFVFAAFGLFVAFELEEELEEEVFELFMFGFVAGMFVFDALAVEDVGTHGVPAGTLGVAGPVGCVFSVAPGTGDGALGVGARTSWPVVVWFRFC